jgi:hypothetical protein
MGYRDKDGIRRMRPRARTCSCESRRACVEHWRCGRVVPEEQLNGKSGHALAPGTQLMVAPKAFDYFLWVAACQPDSRKIGMDQRKKPIAGRVTYCGRRLSCDLGQDLISFIAPCVAANQNANAQRHRGDGNDQSANDDDRNRRSTPRRRRPRRLAPRHLLRRLRPPAPRARRPSRGRRRRGPRA